MYKQAIFPVLYLPPIQFFSKLVQYPNAVYIDKFEHFLKQTYRNRTTIHSPNGRLDLIVPVVRGSKVHTQMKDVKISYDFGWQRLHWMSLQTSYRRSAYFEYYEDEFVPFYEDKFDFLFDYNEALLQKILSLLKITKELKYTVDYEKEHTGLDDYRQNIHPKQIADYKVKPYYQVFEERNSFINNLSIVDLLFNQGPQSHQYLSAHG